MPTSARAAGLVCSALVLLAFGLRAVHLDFQSLWSDEGISLVRSMLPLGTMQAQMPVEHVPGYFVLLHGWIGLTGVSDFGLRFLSLLPSVWAVALIYRLAADLGSRRVGLIASLLLATNGFQVWYAQEARMYSWLLAMGLLATIAYWRLLQRPSWGVWALYVMSMTATVYLHFFGFLAPLSHAAYALLWGLRGGNRRSLVWWVGAGAASGLLFLPWMVRAWDVLGFSGWRAPLDPMQVPWLLLRAYTVGETMPTPWDGRLPWVYLGLVAIGLVAWTRRRAAAGLFLGTLLGVALAVVWLLVMRRPDFHVRYPIFIGVPLLLLAAGGIAPQAIASQRDSPQSRKERKEQGKEDIDLQAGEDAAQRTNGRKALRVASGVVSGIVLAGLVVANGAALARLYGDTALHKPDYRGAAQAITAAAGAHDVVLVDGPNPELVFAHYYTGPAPVHDLRGLEGASAEEIDRTLTEATAGKSTAWELLYFHPPGPVQQWLATHGWPSAPSDHNGIRVMAYGLERGAPAMRSLGVPFGPALVLAEAGVEGPAARPGDLVRVTTRWQVLAPPPDYKFSLRLMGPQGQLILADDYMPQGWFAPTSTWAVGSDGADQRALRLPGDLAPGRYAVTLRLYDPVTGEPVETPAGQDVVLGEVEVAAPEQ
ncbi:MAG: glycosyltransferase family 39 protein [Caldilineaceae bacterium]|nr:glycosyltransferase family 39 protein [Caldilineaceae bacterium]